MMKVNVKMDTPVGYLKKEFNTHYPYLWLDLFKQSTKSSLEIEKVAAAVPIGELWKSTDIQAIDISDQKTIYELEEDFRKKKLIIRILRKSGRSWVTTSRTKDRTLAEQNDAGELMSCIPEGALNEPINSEC